MQLTDKLEAKQAIAKADWECWRKSEEQIEQIQGLFLFDSDDDDQEDTHQDETIRQRWTVELSQHAKEMDVLPSFPSPSPQQHRSHTNTSAQRKWKGKRRKRTRKTVSCDVGSDKKLIKEEAKDACARPHSGIRLYVINEVKEDSTEEKDNNKRNQTNNETANNNKEARIGGGGFSMPSLNNCKGCIDSTIREGLLMDIQLSSNAVNEDGNDNSTSGICGLNKNNDKLLIEVEVEDVCVRSHGENRHINIGNNKDKNEDNTKILSRVQGADLRRFGKNKYKGSFIAVIGGGGVIYSGLLSNLCKEGNTSNNNALGITTVHANYKKWNNEEAEYTRAKPYSCISIQKGKAHLILKIILEVQGADL